MSRERLPRRIGVVLTGGTIGSAIVEAGTESVVSLGPNTDSDRSPELDLIREVAGPDADELVVRRPLELLSEDLNPADWEAIGSAVDDLVREEGVSGVLLLHGTDTMSYTAAALSFMLAGIDVPIVLTGANLPPDHPQSDARTNIRDALVALRWLDPGVYVAFAGEPKRPSFVHLGTCVRKVRASGQAFFSINREPVAQVSKSDFHWIDRPTSGRASWEAPATTLGEGLPRFDDRVLLIRVFPGVNLDALYAATWFAHARGVVIELYPAATGPTTPEVSSLPRFVERCSADGISVVGALAEAPEGPVSLYESSLAIRARGALFLPGILPETATVKLMWALGQTSEPALVEKLMTTPLAGEIVDHEH